MGTVKIVFLGSMPGDESRLRLDKEFREIDARIREAEFRDLLSLRSNWAVRAGDLQRILLREKPQIVHFSGHGSAEDELIFEDHNGLSHPIGAEALADLFRILRDDIRVVVLNACFSKRQAEAINRVIDYTVGMEEEIGDNAAIEFAAAFYQAIAYGRTVGEAFELGCNSLRLHGIPEENTPQLMVRAGVDPNDIVLANP